MTEKKAVIGFFGFHQVYLWPQGNGGRAEVHIAEQAPSGRALGLSAWSRTTLAARVGRLGEASARLLVRGALLCPL